MDEKNNQILTFDDILHQLTKPSMLQGQGQDIGSQAPLSSTSPYQSSPPAPSKDIKLPSLGAETKSTPSPNNIQEKLQPKEVGISLSIRTMADDLLKLKQGQKPVGLEVKKTIQSISNKSASIAPLIPKETTTEVTRKQAVPLPSIPVPKPPIPKAPPLSPAPSERSTLPPIPPIFEKKSSTKDNGEQYNRGETVNKEKYSLPSYLGDVIPKKVVKPVEEKLEYSVLAKVIGSGMTAGIVVTLVMAAIAFLVLKFLVFKEEEPIPSLSPTPIPTQTAQVSEINELNTIFGNISVVNFNMPANQQETASNLKSFMNGTEVSRSEFKKINFVLPDNQVMAPTFKDILNRLSIRHPISLEDVIKENNMTFLYGQQEAFDEISSLPDPKLDRKKIVLVVEVNDMERSSQILKEWELTMPADLGSVLNIDSTKEATSSFLDNNHRGVMIRYKNFPLPDRSIDYTIIRSLSGRYYLVISNSRESMYSPADKIMGF